VLISIIVFLAIFYALVSIRKQSGAIESVLDCFALLAMTSYERS